MDFSQLKKNLKKDFSAFKKIRLAILGDTSTQLMAQSLKAAGYDYAIDLQLFEADFNQVEGQVFDPKSELYEFKPSVIVFFLSSHKLLGKYNKQSLEKNATLAAGELAHIQNLYETVNAGQGAKVIFYNYAEINDSVFGNYANKTESSFLFQLRKLNYLLMEFAARNSGFFICDLSSIQNQYGKNSFFHPSIYVNTEMVMGTELLPEVAFKTLDVVAAMEGRLHKCLVLDLDNTIWGGVIGDDGMENIEVGMLGIGKAFTEFQYWCKKLKNRGIMLAACSKNTESVAKEPFEKHPDMVLKLEDFSVFVANWENKVNNIREIQRTLNIGFDSMVFLDDNPFERNMVRENIPGIVIPELPEDPADYLEYLYGLNLFETVSFSNEDVERTKLYQVDAQRTTLSKKFENEDDFLKSLNMVSIVQPFNKYNTPRVAQLSQRSNQFNLRTVRFTEQDIEKISASHNFETFSFTLQDKFGDNGLICLVVLKKESESTLFIENWLMSCRVLKRGMEDFTLNTLVDFARGQKFSYLKGEYIATAKNEMVRDHYRKLGFGEKDGVWVLDINSYKNRSNNITKSN